MDEAFGRLGAKATAGGTTAIADCIERTNMAFSFGDCDRESGWGLAAYMPRVHFHFYAQKGRASRNASFWESLHDVAGQCNVLAESGRNINLLGYFGTGTGQQQYNWLEGAPAFAGPLNVYGKTILRTFHNHPMRLSRQQARFMTKFH